MKCSHPSRDPRPSTHSEAVVSTLPSMRTGYKWLTGLLIVLSLCFVALMAEASVGHDGLLCEMGYDKDGDGEGVSGCG